MSPKRGIGQSLSYLLWQGTRAAMLIGNLLLLTHWLGVAHYGVLVAQIGLASIIGTFAGGGPGLMLLRDGLNSHVALQHTWARALMATLALAVPCLIGDLLVQHAVLGDRWPLVVALPIAVAEILLLPLVTTCSFVFQTREHMPRAGMMAALIGIERLLSALLLGAVPGGASLQAYSLLHLGLSLLLTVGALHWTAMTAGLSLQPARVDRRWMAAALRQSTMCAVASASGELDKSLALRNGGALVAGEYALMYRAITLLSLPAAALAQIMFPALARLHQSGGHGAWRRLGVTLTQVVSYTALLALSLQMLAAPVFRWAGHGLEALIPRLGSLVLLLGCYNVRQVSCVALQAASLPLVRAAVELTAVIVVAIASALLVPNHGVDGAVAAAVLAEGWILVASLSAALVVLRRTTA